MKTVNIVKVDSNLNMTEAQKELFHAGVLKNFLDPEVPIEANKEQTCDEKQGQSPGVTMNKKAAARSIYNISGQEGDENHGKDTVLQLKNDSSSMGYAVFLKPKDLGVELNNSQRSDVYMNSLFVHLIQMFMLFIDWNFAAWDETFTVLAPTSFDMICARFMASMFMHINVEKDVKHGI